MPHSVCRMNSAWNESAQHSERVCCLQDSSQFCWGSWDMCFDWVGMSRKEKMVLQLRKLCVALENEFLPLSLPKRSCEVLFWDGREKAKHLISWEIWGHGSSFCTTNLKQSVESNDYYSFLHFRETVVCNHIKSCFARELYKCILYHILHSL